MSKRKAWSTPSDEEDDVFDNNAGAQNDEDSDIEEKQLDVVIRAREVRRELSSDTNFSFYPLKSNHTELPLWVCGNGYIFVETFHEDFDKLSEFIVAIAEPVSRPDLIHHYKLTPYSLYAAVSIEYSTDKIIQRLQNLNKFQTLSENVERFIIKCTNSYGKAKLVLKHNKWQVESMYPDVLKTLLTDPKISDARLVPKDVGGQSNAPLTFLNETVKVKELVKEEEEIVGRIKSERQEKIVNFQTKLSLALAQRLEKVEDISDSENEDKESNDIESNEDQKEHKAEVIDIKLQNYGEIEKINAPLLPPKEKGIKVYLGKKTDFIKPEKSDFDDLEENVPKFSDLSIADHSKTVNFEIDGDKIEQVKEGAIKMNFPLMEEYDFRNDKRNADLAIDLVGKLRSYQEKAMEMMFKNGRARSGLIVLPCGAGKTLTGITANCTINKSALVLCSSAVAVEQWIRSYLAFTTASEDLIIKFTKDSKQNLNLDGRNILVTTYFMMSYSKKRNAESARVINQIKNTEWGLLIMDEVHVVPAKMFRKAMVNVKAHCKLGLTATLVREDDLIDDLNFLIGPKLYEANWMKLTSQGYLARVLCAEVWCQMTSEFYREYIREKNAKRRQLLYVMNPMKFAMAKLLMEYHERQGDKVLLFSDNIPALLQYGQKLKRYFMYGNTPEREREWLLARFRLPSDCEPDSPQMKSLEEKFGGLFKDKFSPINTLIISQVGDVAIDLPEANIIIQISSHFGSRRQEAQRLGRILRPKSNARFKIGFNAYFYTLLSRDTSEMFYSTKRQQYLVDQGYTFKVIENLHQIAQMEMGLQYEVPSRKEQIELLKNLTTAYSAQGEELDIGAEDLVNKKNPMNITTSPLVPTIESSKLKKQPVVSSTTSLLKKLQRRR